MANTTGDGPSWLNGAFLESCLLKDNPKHQKVTVSSLKKQPVVDHRNKKSNHVFRVNFKYSSSLEPGTKELYLIVKAPKETKITKILEPAFKGAEAKFYKEFLPKVQGLSNIKIAPKSYLSPKEGVVVLEDMKQDGFDVMNINEQLNFVHCKLYLETLAKMHATGIALQKTNPDLYKKTFSCGRENLKDENYAKEIVHAESIGLQCLVNWIQNKGTDECKPYVSVINQVNDKNTLRQGNLKSSRKLHLKSFIQGHCSPSNVLFKHDSNNKPTDIRLIDFRIFNYDAVACDVINVIWTCADNDVQNDRIDELYSIYCNTFNSTVEQLGFSESKTSEQQLKNEIKENGFHTLVTIGTFLPLTLSKNEPDESIVFSGNSEVKDIQSFYDGDNFSKKYPKILNSANKQGLFKWLQEAINDE